ncbi:response regulator [Oscillochloris sp. ZM17-4]|uniref:ATP-binding response regulator n=1 Tax=Oscillochloris sp. ZM17-4 TaxID=2866714 RepID=UPI001C739560|nr:ATP-binding protein [Oscillochloris sp. ZM17-4]MBX0329849.1 response regulator [Oscillochloris sp. ZM17-4]
MGANDTTALNEQLQQARKEAAYYRKLAEECGVRRLKEAEELSSLIAQLRQTEVVLMQARDEAEAANRAKTQFLATMSHELRTPLTAIIGYSQMMEHLVEMGDYSSVVNDLHHIYNAGRHLLSLINDVLDLSRIEAGSFTIAAERVDVPYLIEDVISTIRPLISQSHNTLEVSCPARMMMMYTDPLKVRQSLLNLLSNATKFTEAGTIRLTVTQEQVDGANWVVFAVADSGIGIAAEQMSKLFKTFSQIDDSLNRRYGGTGLGLALSQRLCQLLGGDITVESRFGVGSVFTMRLPLIAPSEPTLPGDHAPIVPNGAGANPDADLPVVSENIVLLIDESQEAGSLLTQIISPERACIVQAVGADEGVELARDVLPELILLNVLMRSPDGWQALADLRSQPDLAHIPIVMISVDGKQQCGVALGAADHIVGPAGERRPPQSLRRLPAPRSVADYVLIIEDDPASSDLVLGDVEASGWRGVVARSGCEALTAVTSRQPAAIVLDLLLPDIDGLRLINTLRERPGSCACPVVLLMPADMSSADLAQLQDSARRVTCKGSHSLDDLSEQLDIYLSIYGNPDQRRAMDGMG